jgi:hypothetical protein
MQCIATAAHAARATAVVGTGGCLLLAAYSVAAVQVGVGLALRSAGATLRSAGDALDGAGAALQQPAGGQVRPPSPGTPATAHKRSRGARAHPALRLAGAGRADRVRRAGAAGSLLPMPPAALLPACRSTACVPRADGLLREAGLHSP